MDDSRSCLSCGGGLEDGWCSRCGRQHAPPGAGQPHRPHRDPDPTPSSPYAARPPAPPTVGIPTAGAHGQAPYGGAPRRFGPAGHHPPGPYPSAGPPYSDHSGSEAFAGPDPYGHPSGGWRPAAPSTPTYPTAYAPAHPGSGGRRGTGALVAALVSLAFVIVLGVLGYRTISGDAVNGTASGPAEPGGTPGASGGDTAAPGTVGDAAPGDPPGSDGAGNPGQGGSSGGTGQGDTGDGGQSGADAPGTDPGATATDDPPSGNPTADDPSDPAGDRAAAEADLRRLRTESLRGLSLDGRWVLQLASKFDGAEDPYQYAEDGGHVFRLPDILAQHNRLRQEMAGYAYPTLLLLASDFGSPQRARNATIWTTIADPGRISSREAALAACQDLYPALTGDKLRDFCLPRRLTPPGT